tara:strand:+ start:8274 stop:8924 length:651 start_codon:yes stop_codon:yes gene_type:complete
MNKNTHLILYALIFASIISLFFLQLNKSENEITDAKTESFKIDTKKGLIEFKESIDTSNKSSTKIRIAYVNSDTVSKYYKFAQKIQSTLMGKRNEAERQIRSKYSSYENLVRDFEKAAPIMGEREKMEKAQKIRLLEQEIMKVEQTLSEQLSNEEIQVTQSYIIKTDEYMQIIGQSLGFDYVLSYRIGGPMLYANPNLDITTRIIDLLNKKYQNSK